MPRQVQKLKFTPAAIDDTLAWVDDQDKVNMEALLAEGGITDVDEVARVTRELTNSLGMRTLKAIIKKRYQVASSKEADIKDTAWPYRVAFIEGYKTALNEIYRSIPIKPISSTTL